jgi:Holliday junction resolvasome RuvABC DNA-binding subunit
VVFAKNGLQLDFTANVQHAIQNINGIGPKIASLFLRDIAVMYNIFPAKDRHLLQPVDVWVKRAFERLTDHHNPDVETIERGIIKEAARINVLPEAINQGMWYFSSQIADSEYRLSEALDDFGYAKVLIQEYIEAIRQEAAAATIFERK